jgi:hypothetical protein
MKVVAKGKDFLREIGPVNRVMAPAYWVMDYYFDSLRKVVSSLPSGGVSSRCRYRARL